MAKAVRWGCQESYSDSEITVGHPLPGRAADFHCAKLARALYARFSQLAGSRRDSSKAAPQNPSTLAQFCALSPCASPFPPKRTVF